MRMPAAGGVVGVDGVVGVLLPPETPLEQREIFREEMGFNRPLIVQYGDFLTDAIRGDFGDSFRSGRPASELVLERMPATLTLTFTLAEANAEAAALTHATA